MTKRSALVLALLLVSGSSVAAAQTPSPAVASKVETGEINGAPFRIEVPPDWKSGLVMYAHGYAIAGSQPVLGTPNGRLLRDVFLSRGFAFAESAYSIQGWAVKEGIEDTEAVRRYFVAKYGKPSETYMLGHSMGGHIALATIERYPESYEGAMPMCGPLSAALDFFNYGVFDMLVTFEYLFPGTIGSPYTPAAATQDKVRKALAAQPDKASIYARQVERPVEQLPAVLGFFHIIAGELKQRAGGEPFDNTNRIYGGFGDDVALNRGVKRYKADPAARTYLRQYFSPTGRVTDPVLTLHTTSDQLVLGRDVTAYEVATALAGTSHLFVARFVDAVGHCNFTPAQTAAGFDTLRAWAKDGKQPAAGEQR